MAKKTKGKPNKSKAIRDYYAAHPTAKPMDVVAALKAKRIVVTAGFVSTIRSNDKKKRGEIGRPGRPPGSGKSGLTQSAPRHRELSYDSLWKVKSIVDEMGGVAEARAALDALETLIN